ncbi:MAG TPA: rhomboid family intramembrane serine protease [Myxococcota bacterium]|nr:rhomboid family intramembrane serine protease [Myxococcota bacterium]
MEHGLGASGAISGVMGIFAVRCYFKTMIFPLPILGVFSLIIPLSVKFRVNSLVVIGLFFLADLSGGIDQLTGRSFSSVGHWAHVGGMLTGIGFAALLSLGSEAADERHLDIADTALDTGVGIKAGRASLHRILEKDPDTTEALLSLARMESRFHACEEARLAYARCIEVLAPSNPERAASLFEEYFRRYPSCLEARLQYRLTPHLFMRGNLQLSARTLEVLVASPDTPPEIAEKSLFQLGKVYEAMGLAEQSRDVYRRYAGRYPDSVVSAKARSKAEGTA